MIYNFNYGGTYRGLRKMFGVQQRMLDESGISAQSVINFENRNAAVNIDRVLTLLGELPATLHEYTQSLTATPLDTFEGFQRYVAAMNTAPDYERRLGALALQYRIRYASTGDANWAMRAAMLTKPIERREIHAERALITEYLAKVRIWTNYEFVLLQRTLDTVLRIGDVSRFWKQLANWQAISTCHDADRQSRQVFTLLKVCELYLDAGQYQWAWKCLNVVREVPVLESDADNRFVMRRLEAMLLMRDPSGDVVRGRALFADLIDAGEFLGAPSIVCKMQASLASSEEFLNSIPRKA